MRDYAKTRLDIHDDKALNDQLEDFTLYHRKNDSHYVDWYAAWQQWMRNYKNPPWQTNKKNQTNKDIYALRE